MVPVYVHIVGHHLAVQLPCSLQLEIYVFVVLQVVEEGREEQRGVGVLFEVIFVVFEHCLLYRFGRVEPLHKLVGAGYRVLRYGQFQPVQHILIGFVVPLGLIFCCFWNLTTIYSTPTLLRTSLLHSWHIFINSYLSI